MTVTSAHPPDGYIASEHELGFAFSYPADYLRSISWQDRDIEAGGQGLLLAFLTVGEVARSMTTVGKVSRKPLVPFARGGNGDWLCCFDAGDPSKVHVVNLGDSKPAAVEWSSSGYLGFLDEYLANHDLPPWRPSA